jgi:hypothetical protein
MVSLRDRRAIGAGAAVAILAGLGWMWLRPTPTATAGLAMEERADAKASQVPRIDLARIDHKAPASGAGETDVFQFGAPSTKIVLRATAPPVVTNPSGAVGGGGPDVAPTPIPVPAMNVKYIGSVADKKGLKVAVLMTDRREVLTGRAGDLVANRLKIVSIGLESVDIQDVGSDHIRRIPLRAN